MVELVEKNIPNLQDLCLRYRVARLWLFGSAVDATLFREGSDLDFLYEFDVAGEYDPSFPYAAYWSDMLNGLRDLFRRDVQLIPYGQFRNPYFRESVEKTKVLVYDKDTEKVVV